MNSHMLRRLALGLGFLVILGLTAATSVTGYILTVGGSGEASKPLAAPTLDRSTATPNAPQTQIAGLEATVAGLQATNASLLTQVSITKTEPTALPLVTASAPASATVAQTATTVAATTAPTTAGTPTIYRIVAERSLVSFTLTEDLMDEATTVIGTTTQVAGEILVDMATPANSKVGLIRINARTLETDSAFRNKALRGQILESSRDEYEFIDFTPTVITALAGTVQRGQPTTFKISGDLKIRAIVQPVTFDVTVTVTDSQLEGTATAQVTREQFNLQIPSVPGVANVSNDVTLTIQFVAVPVP